MNDALTSAKSWHVVASSRTEALFKVQFLDLAAAGTAQWFTG